MESKRQLDLGLKVRMMFAFFFVIFDDWLVFLVLLHVSHSISPDHRLQGWTSAKACVFELSDVSLVSKS